MLFQHFNFTARKKINKQTFASFSELFLTTRSRTSNGKQLGGAESRFSFTLMKFIINFSPVSEMSPRFSIKSVCLLVCSLQLSSHIKNLMSAKCHNFVRIHSQKMYKVSVLLTDGLGLVADPGALDPAVAAGAAAPLLDAVPGLLAGAAPHLPVTGVARVVTCNVNG